MLSSRTAQLVPTSRRRQGDGAQATTSTQANREAGGRGTRTPRAATLTASWSMTLRPNSLPACCAAALWSSPFRC